MFLCTQYYRPPFPPRQYWADDLARMADSGLHAVQLWCLWSWIESEPGVYNYDDYDELFDLADRNGLKVVLSSIAEIHPFWIHRVVPDSAMINHLGAKVCSGPRNEVNVGITPGGCFDNPRVEELMRNFLADLAARYAGAGNLLAWDIWNETRWNVHSEGYVCYCEHSLRAFREWLDRRHGGLDGLNRAWMRRYDSWEDVVPGKAFARPYTDQMEFTRWLMERASAHLAMRYDAIRTADPNPDHLISAHCAAPSIQAGGVGNEQALCRGNDWHHADVVEGYGCSHFPFKGTGFDDAGFGVRVEEVRSANRGKVTWVSELQGGSARNSLTCAFRSVPAGPQQRWVASGMARGAKAVIFWCWRDEVFGIESSGFGLAGWDGLAEERLAAMKNTGAFISEHQELLDAYQPEAAKVGVFFAPDNHLLGYADSGKATDSTSSVASCAVALERLGLPYDFVEADHIESLESLSVLIMPYCMVLPDKAREAILAFLRRGGRVYCEAETDAFSPLGFYRYPDERPFMQAIGVQDLGRRELPEDATLTALLGEERVWLRPNLMFTPLHAPDADVLATDSQDQPMLVRQQVGEGAAYVCGSFVSMGCLNDRCKGFETLLDHLCRDAGVEIDFEVRFDGARADDVIVRTGLAGEKKRLLWLINTGTRKQVVVHDQAGKLTSDAVENLATGESLNVAGEAGSRSIELTLPDGGWSVLAWPTMG